MTNAVKKMFLDWVSIHQDPDFDKITISDVREAFNTIPNFIEDDVQFFLEHLENYTKKELIDAATEMNVVLQDDDDIYFGATTKEQEASNRDIEYYLKLKTEVCSKVIEKINSFTTVEEWVALWSWMGENELCDKMISDLYIKNAKTQKNYVKRMSSHPEFSEWKTIGQEHIWGLFNGAHKFDKMEERGRANMLRRVYYYYNELLQYWN